MSSSGPFESFTLFFKNLFKSTPDISPINTQLIKAVLEHDAIEVERCLANGAKIEGLMIENQSLLTYAISHDPTVKIRQLGQPSLSLRSSQDRDLTLIKLLIDAGANVNDTWRFGLSLLHFAVNAGWTALVQLLIISGATVDYDYGHTPLWTAASLGYDDIIETLFCAGADLDKQGKLNLSEHQSQDPLLTPTEIAYIHGHQKTVSYLCRLGAKAPNVSMLDTDSHSSSAPMIFSGGHSSKASTPIPIPKAKPISHFSSRSSHSPRKT